MAPDWIIVEIRVVDLLKLPFFVVLSILFLMTYQNLSTLVSLISHQLNSFTEFVSWLVINSIRVLGPFLCFLKSFLTSNIDHSDFLNRNFRKRLILYFSYWQGCSTYNIWYMSEFVIPELNDLFWKELIEIKENHIYYLLQIIAFPLWASGFPLGFLWEFILEVLCFIFYLQELFFLFPHFAYIFGFWCFCIVLKFWCLEIFCQDICNLLKENVQNSQGRFQ